MLEVDKDAFESKTDWATVTADDIVYSGSVTVHNTDAKPFTFELDNPFTYSGTGNLLIAFNKATNNWKSGLRGMVFGADGDAVRAIYAYQDTGAYDPTNPTFSANGTSYQRNVVLFDITPSGGTICDKPETLETVLLTDTHAMISWEGGSGNYNVQFKVASDEEWAVVGENVDYTSYHFTTLDPNTAYSFRVQSVCDGGTTSGWKNINFTTVNPCAAPTNLVVSDITPSSVTLSWTAGNQETSWTVKYKKSSETEYITETVDAPTISLTGLDGLTTYNVQVYNCTEEGSPYLSGNFTTAANIPLVEEFPTTSLPTGWAKYSGLLSDALNGTAPTTTSNGWFFGNNNGVFDNHARINIYGTNCKYWLAMPAVVMEDNVQLSFEVAYTAYNGTAQTPQQTGTDDKFVVLVSTDNMASWTILRQWDNDGSEYVLNDLNVTPIPVNFDLSSYAGQSVIVAFYVESTESNADNNLHIDNVSIDYIAACPKPAVLIVGDVAAHTAQLSWTSDAGAWQICLNEDEDNPIDVSTNPYTLEDLADGTTYTVKVRTNCGNNGYSEWSNEVSFTTPIACPAPTGLVVSNISGHQATLTWTGNSEGYNVYYRTMASAEEGGIFESFKTTSIPSGWSRYSTLLTDDVLNGTTALASSTSGWSFGSANGVFDSHAKINIYSTSCKYWLVTPSVEVAANYVFDFDLALTKYSGTLQPVDPTQQADDRFVVLISTDDMATWTILRQWDNAGSDYVYNNIACTATGEHVSFDLSAYIGQNVRIAFYGESTVSGGDNELHIDNVLVGIPVPVGEWQTEYTEENTYTLTDLTPETDYEAYVESVCSGEQSYVTNVISFTTDVACPAPTGLTAANVGPTSAELSWTSGADAWEIEVTDVVTGEVVATVTADTNPFTVTGLSPETAYSVRVRGNCGDEGYSEWSGSAIFTTLEACPNPEDLAVSDITYNSATVAWTGFNDSYVVSYRTAAGVDALFKQNFENELGEWTFTSMNAANDIGGSGTYPAGICSEAAHRGSYGFRFSSYTSKTGDETYDQYLVSPELTETGNFKFYFKKSGSSTETLYLGYSTTTNDLDDEDAWTWTEDLAPTTNWQEYTLELPEDVKYIAFHYFGNYTYYVYVDDITISVTEIPAGEWETVEATESPVILTDLTPETEYEVKVQGFCDGEPTEETGVVTFTTPELTILFNTYTLAAGWNWVSFNIDITLDDLKAALVEASGSNGNSVISIHSQTQNTTYKRGRWTGQLNTLDLTQMYMINVPVDCEMVLEGMYIDPAEYPVIIKNGDNWIGFPLSEPISINNAFAGFAENGDIIQSQTAFAVYTYGMWRGTLTTLEPGQGYIYQSAASEERVFVFPTYAKAASGSKANETGYESHWAEFNYHQYQYNQPLVATIQIDGSTIDCENVNWADLEVAAFVNDECRGSAFLEGRYMEDGDPYPVIEMPVYYNNPGEYVTFKLYDHLNLIEYDNYDCSITPILTGESYVEYNFDEDAFVSLNFASATIDLLVLANDDSQMGDDEKNSALIEDAYNEGETVNVKLAGRTLYKDGKWNTICLPFDVDLSDGPLAGAHAKTLTDATMEGTHVTLTFGEEVEMLEAGKPYIIKWVEDEGNDIYEPVFENVTIVWNDEDDHTVSPIDEVKFIGYYDALQLDPENDTEDFYAADVPNIYYMTADNTLKHTGVARTLKSCRAYFQFAEGSKIRQFTLNFGDGEISGIMTVDDTNDTNGVWYTVDGKKLDKQPTRKGLYIKDGVKVVIK